MSRVGCPSLHIYRQYQSDFILRTLTCNRLSHCLFDFDCPDLSIYEKESYSYQEFTFKATPPSFNQVQDCNEAQLPSEGFCHDELMARFEQTTNDCFVLREQSKIFCRKPSTRVEYDPDKFVLRFLYKPKEGSLWCFNRPNLAQEYF
jgi:hypothetical protein